MRISNNSRRTQLLVGAAPFSIVLAMISAPAAAQETPAAASAPQTAAPQSSGDAPADATPDIVVTGSLLSRTNVETPSPVTVVTADDLQKRGITTVQAGLQALSANSGPQLVNSFTANGAFAGGGSAASLRALTTNSTLVLFDGLRASYYPLADDGTRNFVDLNTIPDAIVDRVEVLKDGASSNYGADAVAGVINVITKRQIVGFHALAEAGITERGDAANRRFSATYGLGDLADKGFNVYVSAHYLHSDPLYNRDRGYPFNTLDQRGLCYGGVCGSDNTLNGSNDGVFNGFALRPPVATFFVQPYDATNTTPSGRYQLLNGCNGLTPYTLSAADLAANPDAPRTVCQDDIVRNYYQIEPDNTRWGVSGRATVKLGSNAEFYTELNYERSELAYTGLPSAIYANVPAGIVYPAYSTRTGAGILTLPIYVCPRGTTAACTAANGTLNPNNPFAASGQVARVVGALPNSLEYNQSISNVFRGAMGLKGSFGDGWRYSVDGTAMVSKLKTTAKGFVYVQHLLDEIADGSYNFVNPSANSRAVLDYLMPTQYIDYSSHLYQAQASISKDLFKLPGGDLQLAVGVAGRYESINDPSGNPDYNGPTNRYFRLNAFGAKGHRYVESAYFELNAPVLDVLEINAAGRFDHYSNDLNNFSPKVGIKFTPLKQIALRGTFSKGFRIPSFAEAGALPTTGYVSTPLTQLAQSYIDQHLTASGQPDLYITECTPPSTCAGQTTVGNPNLKPEKSRSFTGGVILEPIRNVSFTVDYYNIQKTNAITNVNFSGATINYYATGQTSFNGVTILTDSPDPLHPGALPRIKYLQGSFINANKISTSGIDFGANVKVKLGGDVTYSSSLDASYIFYLNTTFPDGHTERYAGTAGNSSLTAGTGTPRWKGVWVNTLAFGPAALTVTANYTSGYNYSAEDQGGTAGDCSLVPTNINGDAFQPCNVKSALFFDLHGEVKVGGKFTFYGDVLNVADRKPPIDGITYGAYLYNPAVGEEGIIGRAFRFGAKVDF